MEVYKEDLKKVKEELNEVGSLIEDLLTRQSDLLEKKKSLEQIIKEHNETSTTVNIDWSKEDFPWSNKLNTNLKDVFKLDKLRPMQLQTMNITMSGKDCILIMPTGGGKSLCFQLPAVISKGITLVVSPLISLMEDQLMALKALNINSTTFNSNTNTADAKMIQTAMTDPNSTLKLLYVTPEKLAKSKRFMNKLEKMYEMGRFSRLVIDEVHCCSQWGHDFRPDFKFLGIMKRQFPTVPILGLTATATLKVLDDVKNILNIPNCQLLRASFNRPNLYYEVRTKPSSFSDTMTEIKTLIQTRFSGQSGIVYCFSKKDCEEVTIDLQKNGIPSGCYHANLTGSERSRVHEKWSQGKILVVVATIAFGMGIDKPDVRFVIHHSISKSIENLYQESGRAGRDNTKSSCVVYFRLADAFRQSCMVFTEQTGLKCLYGILAYCLNSKRCRRSMIAEHFGELWDTSHCDGMCDHCDPNSIYTSTSVDITTHCRNILTILQQAADTDQKVTALKLIDAWFGKGPAPLRVKDIKEKNISIEKAEKIIGFMLLNDYLKEDFHFTAYTTISYIKPGRKANLILGGNTKSVMLDIQVKALGVTKTSKSPQKCTSVKKPSKPVEGSSKKQKSFSEKPQICVINRETSQMTSITADVKSATSSLKKDNSNKKKRKPLFIDSDDSDLDFGDFSPAKKKMNISSDGDNDLTKSNGISDTICIESDSDFES